MGLTDGIQAKLDGEIRVEIENAQALLYGTAYYDELYTGKMTAALAHTNIALIKQRELDELRASR